jgi:hypothetical protein
MNILSIRQDTSRFKDGKPLTGTALFVAARNKVWWAYQKLELGWVGGRIVAEVFYGLMDSDKESYVYAKDWKPIWNPGLDIFASLLRFAGQYISCTD